MMNIEELKTARNQLEKELLHLIGSKVDTFKQQTGVMVESVNVDLRFAQSLGAMPLASVVGVRVGLIL